MEAPQSKAKPAKSAAKQEEQPPQQQQHQQPASVESDSSHEGFVDHAGDTLDDAAAAAGESKHDCPGVDEHGFCHGLAVAQDILSKPTQT